MEHGALSMEPLFGPRDQKSEITNQEVRDRRSEVGRKTEIRSQRIGYQQESERSSSVVRVRDQKRARVLDHTAEHLSDLLTQIR